MVARENPAVHRYNILFEEVKPLSLKTDLCRNKKRVKKYTPRSQFITWHKDLAVYYPGSRIIGQGAESYFVAIA